MSDRKNFFDIIGVSREEADKRVEAIWQSMFEGPDKIYFEDGDTGYVTDTGNNDVRTEGMSYAMMICVQLDKKDHFDRIWKWTLRNMYLTDGFNSGYFCWSNQLDGTKNADGPAPDGEEFFVMDLFFASRRWGDGEGELNYSEWALKIANECIWHGYPGNYAMWNRTNHLILFIPGWGYSDPSYHLPHFYHFFAEYDKKNSEFWLKAEEASREYWKISCHPVTGLNPEYADFDGNPVDGSDMNGERHDWFFSDAYRTHANIALDELWHGKNPWALEEITKVLTFFDELPEDCKTGVFLIDGTLVDKVARHPNGLEATLAQAAMTVIDEGDPSSHVYEVARYYIEKLWNSEPRTGIRRYYDNFLYLFAFMALSGNYRMI